MRALKIVGWTLAWLIALLCAAWATGALYFDFPVPALRGPAAVVFALILLAAVILVRGRIRKLAAVFGGFAVVALWWLTLKPSNDCNWQPDVARTA
jgi:hypothetical protein